MATITTLPVELLEMIFQYAYGEFINPFNDEKKPPSKDVIFPRPGRHLFPYNVASASSQWLAILKSSPRYWKRIIIDLAVDPAPFLDVFSISQSNANSESYLDVVVFSSLKKSRPCGGDTGTATDVEYRRGRAGFENLAPHIPRCRSIMFDLVYESSLPSAAVVFAAQTGGLCALSLKCKIKNTDLGRRTSWRIGPRPRMLHSGVD